MNNFLSEINVQGLFDRLSFHLSFNPGINVIHAANGAGKTTLLHILANALNGDFHRFAYLQFKEIEIVFSDQQRINIFRLVNDTQPVLKVEVNSKTLIADLPIRKIRRPAHLRESVDARQLSLFDEMIDEDGEDRFKPILTAEYFPAFRTMIEAWGNTNEEDLYRRTRTVEGLAEIEYELKKQGLSRREMRFQVISTFEARRAFGEFVPVISYPSPAEITRSLDEELQSALLAVGNTDRELLSQVFIDVFKALSDTSYPDVKHTDAEKILSEIQNMLSDDDQGNLFQYVQDVSLTKTDAYGRLREAVQSMRLDSSREVAVPILNVYRESLEDRSKARQEAFRRLELYLKSVNEFLSEGKSIVLLNSNRRGRPSVGIRFSDGTTLNGLRALSSGERQIVTLIYAATRMNSQDVILIDEPEISLHIDWQRILLDKMIEQIGGRQIIVCTHSPSIGADYFDSMIELKPVYSTSGGTLQDDTSGEFDDEDMHFN